MKGRIAGAACVLGLTASGAACAQSAAPFGMPMDDSRVFAHLLMDQFEARLGSSNAFWWDAQAWVGSDENRVYLLTEGETANGAVTDAQHELLYVHPVSAFFDVRAGIRTDTDSTQHRSWAALGIAGLAPYFVQLSGTVYASDSGHYAAKGTASYDLLLTQRLILTPAVELNVQSGGGLTGLEAGLRLRYEITRKIGPYLGVNYERNVAAGIEANATRVVLGLHAWL